MTPDICHSLSALHLSVSVSLYAHIFTFKYKFISECILYKHVIYILYIM